MRAIISILAVSLLVPHGGVPVLRGQQVRVTAPECGIHGQIGSFDGLRGDTLLLAFGTSTVRCVRSSVTSLDQSHESKSNTLRGMGYGLLVGSIGGAVVGAATYQECVPEGWFDCFMVPESAGQAAALGGIVGGALGAGLGAIFGALTKTDPWQEVPLDQLSVSFSPQRDRFALGLSVRF